MCERNDPIDGDRTSEHVHKNTAYIDLKMQKVPNTQIDMISHNNVI